MGSFRSWLPALLALGIGAWSWLHVAASSGRREAWDSETYWTTAMPLLAVAAFVFGLAVPRRPWRWGALLFCGQALAALAGGRAGNLLPLGLVLFALFGALAVVPAKLGARLGAKLRRRTSRGGSGRA